MRGIDVSFCQRNFPWNRFEGDFAMIKASQGFSDYGSYASDFIEDTEYRRNAAACTALKIPWGAFHYLTAQNVSEAVREARGYCSVLDGHKGDMRLWAAVDVESTIWLPDDHKLLTYIVEVFCNEVKEHGYAPMVYSAPIFLYRRFDPPADVPLWLALWGTERAAKKYEPTIWQYGIDHNYNVDGDVGYFALPQVSVNEASPVWSVGDVYEMKEGDVYANGRGVPARLWGNKYEIGRVKDGKVYLPALWSWVKV